MESKQKTFSCLAAQFAQQVTQEIYGDDGPDDDCDIDLIEDHAVAVAKAAFDAVIARALQLQNQRQPDQLPCPVCQQQCEVKTEQRTIQGRLAPATIEEIVCSCSTCSRDFFPSA